MNELHLKSPETLNEQAQQFVAWFKKPCVVAFYAPMGAGKTTFIKAVCEVLGASDQVTSPTFALVNEYVATSGELIYHFDCYRIKNLTEAYDLGADEYFYSGHFCFVEWPEKIEELLPDDVVRVQIDVQDDGSRILRLQK